MKIILKNKIQLDADTELIHEEYEGDYKEKSGSKYLIFTGNDKEKVVLKFSQTELVMTRFSNPKSSMRFRLDHLTEALIVTPVGLNQFVIKTDYYSIDEENQAIKLSYGLFADADSDQPLAFYTMTIIWK